MQCYAFWYVSIEVTVKAIKTTRRGSSCRITIPRTLNRPDHQRVMVAVESDGRADRTQSELVSSKVQGALSYGRPEQSRVNEIRFDDFASII